MKNPTHSKQKRHNFISRTKTDLIKLNNALIK